MTISDLTARLAKIQKEIGNMVQVKIGKEYNSCECVFDCFNVKVIGENKEKEVVLVPSDVWERDLEKRRR
jgi:hypothetical protein